MHKLFDELRQTVYSTGAADGSLAMGPRINGGLLPSCDKWEFAIVIKRQLELSDL